MENIIKALEWRYAVKQFNPKQKLNDEQVNELKRIIQLSASSFGLQPYKVLVISDDNIKEKLKEHSYNQSQITDASHLFIFCSMLDFDKNDVQDFVNLNMEVTGSTHEQIKAYKEMMEMKIDSMNAMENLQWASKQAYIALGFLLSGGAALGIDLCPMEGFIPDGYDKVLHLKEKGLMPLVLAAAGYRSGDDKYRLNKKVRKSFDNLFLEI